MAARKKHSSMVPRKKHYRPAGKKKEGNAARYITRSQAIKQLQVTLGFFRRLSILKGIFPREPKKKFKGNNHTYYHVKDVAFLQHEPLLDKFRDIRAYQKKIKKAEAKKNADLATLLRTREPTYKLDKLVRERYPKFVDALRDLDDCLTMVHLFAALPAVERAKIDVELIHNCRRLSHEWQAYVCRTYKLRKVFISVKGIYYQAEIEGQKITWLTPHAMQQILPDDVNFSVMLTFLEFYEVQISIFGCEMPILCYLSVSIGFCMLYSMASVSFAHLTYHAAIDSADLYALSRYIVSNTRTSTLEPKAASSSTSEQLEAKEKEMQADESELRLAQLQHQLPSNEPGALMHLMEGAECENEDDQDTKECKRLFKNMKFFLSREVPRESLLFVIPAFGGVVSWDGEAAPYKEADQSISHQIVDRPTQGHRYLSREYVQPQWIYDCINARIILPTEAYMVGRIPPPHLSPFVDNDAEGYIPDYAETIKRLQAAARNEVLPMPGVGKEDLDDPQNLLVEGYISRAEANEAAQTKKKMVTLEKQYHEELQSELQGAVMKKSKQGSAEHAKT
uniref:Pescadillo homolog n=1 Tax=Salix viminalis TaxID=40686 RepID=A0A6N2LF90_SALVM